jgi:hypothetical protein
MHPDVETGATTIPFLEAVIADGGYQGVETAAAVYRAAKAPLQIVKRKGLPGSVETLDRRADLRLAWTLQRLAKDFENLGTGSGAAAPVARRRVG